jgi:hypothetical protein
MSIQILRARTFFSLCTYLASAVVLQNVLATELQKAVEGQVRPLATSVAVCRSILVYSLWPLYHPVWFLIECLADLP